MKQVKVVPRKTFYLKPSTQADKKWMVTDLDNGKEVHFGDPDYEDFTQHQDPRRQSQYLQRHRTTENWRDLTSAGAWSRYLLWNEPNLADSIDTMERLFRIVIISEDDIMRP